MKKQAQHYILVPSIAICHTSLYLITLPKKTGESKVSYTSYMLRLAILQTIG